MMKHHSFGMRIVLFLVALLMLSSMVHALSIAPAMKQIEYKEGGVENVRLRILNPDAKDFKVLVYAKGDLADAIEIENSVVSVSANEAEKWIYYKVKMEKGLTPGPNEANIFVVELPEGEDTIIIQDGDEVIVSSGSKVSQVSTRTGVISKARVNVPFPGKYLRSKLDTRGSEFGKPVEFVLPTYHLGSEIIDEVYAEIEIKGPTNELLETITTQKTSLAPHADVNLRANWDTVPNPGLYYAHAYLHYDGKVVDYQGTFLVGETVIDVKNVSFEPFSLGDTAKIDVTVQSKWNEILPGVYADFSFFNSEGAQVGEFKSAAVELQPHIPEIIRAYWDTVGLIEGNYVMQLDLYNGEKVETVKIDIHVAPDEISTTFGVGNVVADQTGFTFDRNSILVSLVIIFALMNVYMIVFVNRKLKNAGKRPPREGYGGSPGNGGGSSYASQFNAQESRSETQEFSHTLQRLQQDQLRTQYGQHVDSQKNTTHTLEQLERLERLQQNGRGGFNG